MNIWCGIIDHFIGPFTIEEHLTVVRYSRILKNLFLMLLNEVSLTVRHQLWREHDGTPPHFTRQVTSFLNKS